MPDTAHGGVSAPRVFINGCFLIQRLTEVQRYGRGTTVCLDDVLANGEGADIRWTLLVLRGTSTPAFRYIMLEPVS